MTAAPVSTPASRRRLPRLQFRVWHLALLVLFVALAIVNIQDQRHSEPALIALASAGFVAYWLLGWLGWRLARRFDVRLGRTPVLILYLIGMSAFFLGATVVYLVVEYAYVVTHVR
jgi:hypothetical protein